MVEDLLFEIGTEELPPRSLRSLMNALGAGLRDGLDRHELGFDTISTYATPRRLAVIVTDLAERQPDQQMERRGPSVAAAFDADGRPTRAATGFAASCGCEVAALDRLETEKGAWLLYRETRPGQPVDALIPALIEAALDDLPIDRRMRWGKRQVSFVRPAHWCILMYGERVIDAQIVGQRSGASSLGHRFMSSGDIQVARPDEYVEVLRKASVVVDFEERRRIITDQLQAAAIGLNGTVVLDDDLLDEVTSLVEWPVALAGRFDARFLDVPTEVLISAMTEHQRYFHVLDGDGALMPCFLTVANIESRAPEQVVAGNERVILPRLSDADFFYRKDCATPLTAQRGRLADVVFQSRLGSYRDKADRVSALAEHLATAIGADPKVSSRAGALCKVDLVSNMVGEFPDLQGTMGGYYAAHDGEGEGVAAAIRDHYRPTSSGGDLPLTIEGCCVAMADKLDTLVGLFGIGQPPTGSRDPFALRRAALGVIRIAVEKRLDIDLRRSLEFAASTFDESFDIEPVLAYMSERASYWYQDQDIPGDVFIAASRSTAGFSSILACHSKVIALNAFRAHERMDQVTAANKRVANLLKADSDFSVVDESLFTEPAESALYEEMQAKSRALASLEAGQSFAEMLVELAGLQPHIDRYFDDVLVMADDESVRENRLATLAVMRGLFLTVADFSELQI